MLKMSDLKQTATFLYFEAKVQSTVNPRINRPHEILVEMCDQFLMYFKQCISYFGIPDRTGTRYAK